MPHSTHAYGFERKINTWAASLAARLSGTYEKSFLMILSSEGEVLDLTFQEPEDHWNAKLDDLEKAKRPFLFYDPFDVPDYSYLCWHAIERTAMERLLGEVFEGADFNTIRLRPKRDAPAGTLVPVHSVEEKVDYPTSWSVMF